MQHFKRMLCLALAFVLVSGILAAPAKALQNGSEDPMARKDFDSFGAAAPEEPDTTEEAAPQEIPEETMVLETQPEAQEETVPATEAVEETVPEETASEAVEETVPQATEETIPVQETAAEETVPATEAAEETVPAEETAEKAEFPEIPEADHGMPLFFQTDYPNTRFGSGTVADNGCSITSLAMVATYMTGHVYLPDELARYFGGRAENNIARLEMGSEALELPFKKSVDWHETFAALKDGKIVIALMGETSLFTQSQHFIVLTGMNEEGRILVNDSYAPNYKKWELKKGFAEGFEPHEILQGYSGGWIYDMEAMPEDPFIYYVPEPVRPEIRYPDIQLTEEEMDLLARVVWVESRGECDEGQQAVAEVVFNRMACGDFPDTLHDVIYGEGQFRSVPFLDDAEPYQTQYDAIERAIYGPYVLPEDVYYFATFPSTDKIWGKIGGHIFCYAQN